MTLTPVADRTCPLRLLFAVGAGRARAGLKQVTPSPATGRVNADALTARVCGEGVGDTLGVPAGTVVSEAQSSDFSPAGSSCPALSSCGLSSA
ncbi:hypothetical protein Misp01_59990 [Microtetraspora sp. NBRC 13810]|nr:hypothetical protein Misp01_59990 [Microtetraspora sp. NBRC 13810]